MCAFRGACRPSSESWSRESIDDKIFKSKRQNQRERIFEGELIGSSWILHFHFSHRDKNNKREIRRSGYFKLDESGALSIRQLFSVTKLLECFELKENSSVSNNVKQFEGSWRHIKGFHTRHMLIKIYVYMYICTHYIAVIIILLVIKLILWYNEKCQVVPSREGNSWRFVAIVIPPVDDLGILALFVVLLFRRVVESSERVDVFFSRHLQPLCDVLLRFWKKPLIIQPAKTWIKLAKGIEISPAIYL